MQMGNSIIGFFIQVCRPGLPNLGLFELDFPLVTIDRPMAKFLDHMTTLDFNITSGQTIPHYCPT
jgi:hypothetical protein